MKALVLWLVDWFAFRDEPNDNREIFNPKRHGAKPLEW